MAFQVSFDSFDFMQQKYGAFPTPILMIVVVDEPSAHQCNGRYENNPILDLLRGDATVFAAYQELIGGPGERREAPPAWQGIPDEVSYLWMETSPSYRNMHLDCWPMYQGNPILYTFATYKTGVWDVDWRGTNYHFVNPKVWYYMRRLDYLVNWDKDHWVFLDESAMPLDYEIQRRTFGYFHLWDVMGRIYREGANPCSTSVLLATIKKVTGQDFTSWFEKYILGPGAAENLAQDYYKDSDNDGVWDWIEEDVGLDPHNPDTDGDGLIDGQEMGLRWVSKSATFTDPLCPLCPESQTKETYCNITNVLSATDADKITQEAPLFVADVNLTEAKIKPDGNLADWGTIAPIKTDPLESNVIEDITALYVTKDEKFLYLRVDGDFNLQSDAQMTIEIVAKPLEGDTVLVQSLTSSEEISTLHVIPFQSNGQLRFSAQAVYLGATWTDTVYEAIIPWKLLGGQPKDTVFKVYVVQGGQIMEALPKAEVAWFLTPQPSNEGLAGVPGTTVTTTPTATGTPTPVPSVSPIPTLQANASPSQSLSGRLQPMLLWGSTILLFVVGVWIGSNFPRQLS